MKKPEFIARQGRCPTGLLGHIVARIMAFETRGENERTLEILGLEDYDDVLEIGFGHGHTLNRAAHFIRHGRLAGVDFSRLMLDLAEHRNRCHISGGRMELKLADSAKLPFTNASFDKAFSVHTIYFWPDPASHLAEAFRVLRPDGRFVLGFRSCEDNDAVAAFPSSVYRFPAVSEVEAALELCGFVTLQATTEPIGPRMITWIVAEKPAINRAISPTIKQKEIPTCA